MWLTRVIQGVLLVSTATLYFFAIRDELRGKGILLQRRSNDEDCRGVKSGERGI